MKPEPIISPFLWRKQPSQIDTRDLVVSSTLRAASTRKVQQERAAGTDNSTIRGLSRKADAMTLSKEVLRDRHGGAYGRARQYAVPHGAPMQPDSKTGRLLAALKAGPMTSAQLAAVVGIEPKSVGALLYHHELRGLLKKNRDVWPQTFELVANK